MNLLTDAWIRVAGANGESRLVSPAEITSPEVAATDILAPRPDFRAALYQFLIAVLQLPYAPADWEEWAERWTPPSREELQAAFGPHLRAFELDSDGPSLMQDLDLLSSTEACGIGGLLIDAPGGNTVLLNKDLFIHRDGVRGMCPACAATALFTLQVNAPSGGAGHRVSLRGGGPLTTLRVPSNPDATLWQKLWANVLPTEALGYPPMKDTELVLPWLAPTRTSDAGGPGTTEPLPKIAHPMQSYWSMPRRIRLDFTGLHAGTCDVCGSSTDRLVRQYRTQNYGVNYAGAWEHPLTPYNYDPKQGGQPISLKGQRGGIGYRHWLALTLGGDNGKAAAVIRHFSLAERLLPDAAAKVQLWVSGFDMDNAKARCWYDATLPLYAIDPDRLEVFRGVVADMVAVADEAARALNRSVKEAATNRPADMESNPAVAQSFWQGSEHDFYATLRNATQTDLNNSVDRTKLYEHWLRTVQRVAFRLFDQWVLAVPIEEMDMQRVVQAKANLVKAMNKGKAAELWKEIRANAEAA